MESYDALDETRADERDKWRAPAVQQRIRASVIGANEGRAEHILSPPLARGQ